MNNFVPIPNYAIELFIWMAIATLLGMLIGWLTWGKKLKLVLNKYSNLYRQAEFEKNQSSKKIAKLIEELESSRSQLTAISKVKNSEIENMYINQLEKELEDEKLKSREFQAQLDQLKSQINLQ